MESTIDLKTEYLNPSIANFRPDVSNGQIQTENYLLLKFEEASSIFRKLVVSSQLALLYACWGKALLSQKYVGYFKSHFNEEIYPQLKENEKEVQKISDALDSWEKIDFETKQLIMFGKYKEALDECGNVPFAFSGLNHSVQIIRLEILEKMIEREKSGFTRWDDVFRTASSIILIDPSNTKARTLRFDATRTIPRYDNVIKDAEHVLKYEDDSQKRNRVILHLNAFFELKKKEVCSLLGIQKVLPMEEINKFVHDEKKMAVFDEHQKWNISGIVKECNEFRRIILDPFSYIRKRNEKEKESPPPNLVWNEEMEKLDKLISDPMNSLSQEEMLQIWQKRNQELQKNKDKMIYKSRKKLFFDVDNAKEKLKEFLKEKQEEFNMQMELKGEEIKKKNKEISLLKEKLRTLKNQK